MKKNSLQLFWHVKSEIPFSQISNKEFENLLHLTNALQNPPQTIKKSNEETKDLMTRFKQVNHLLDPSENLTNCDYYDVNDISKLRISENNLSVIHLNISSLPLHIKELKLLLSFFKGKFDIFSISENRITKKATPWTYILQLNLRQELAYYTSPTQLFTNYKMI